MRFREKFAFNEGDEVKIIVVSFLYASENKPERIYLAELVEIEEYGFWARLKTVTVHPYSDEDRLPGVTEELDEEEFFGFNEVEEVLPITADYPNRRDPLIRFALDGPSW